MGHGVTLTTCRESYVKYAKDISLDKFWTFILYQRMSLFVNQLQYDMYYFDNTENNKIFTMPKHKLLC